MPNDVLKPKLDICNNPGQDISSLAERVMQYAHEQGESIISSFKNTTKSQLTP